MNQYNLKPKGTLPQIYAKGYLPQRNKKGLFYRGQPCRSRLKENFQLSSENKRILKKTEKFRFDFLPLSQFSYTPALQKLLQSWIKKLAWEFPSASLKQVFTKHLFNYLYLWYEPDNSTPIAYALCYFDKKISHIAYVFFDPQQQKSGLVLRLVLQTIIDSQKRGLEYCYLGNWANYKRNMPGFQVFNNTSWTTTLPSPSVPSPSVPSPSTPSISLTPPQSIHIIGIAGHTSSALALALKNQGHHISGSDQEKIYPPAGPLLQKHGISVNQNNLNSQTNLVIVGNFPENVKKIKEDLATLEKLKLPYLTLTDFLAQKIARKNAITVTGAHGKSSTSALLTWILQKNGLNPSYMFGSPLVDGTPSLAINNSDWSVLEGDEAFHGFDKKAKFLYFPQKYTIITSTYWEHKDCYSSEKGNLQAYLSLVSQIPSNGILVLNKKDPNSLLLSQKAHCPVLFYNQGPLQYQTKLLGSYNLENIDAAFTLSQALKLDQRKTLEAIKTFPGLKRRLEKIKEKNGILFFDDFAQDSQRVKQALLTLQKNYPQKNIKVFFEPHASFLKRKEALKDFAEAFLPAKKVILTKISYDPKISPAQRSTFSTWKNILKNKLVYFPLPEHLEKYLQTDLKKGDLLIHMSSGGLKGQEILKRL